MSIWIPHFSQDSHFHHVAMSFFTPSPSPRQSEATMPPQSSDLGPFCGNPMNAFLYKYFAIKT